MEVSVGEVNIAGGYPELAAAADAIKVRLAGHTVPLSDIYAATGELERAYAAAGFPLTRVTVPPQRLVPGGPIRIMIIEGYIERVDLAGVTARYRGFVWSRLAKLVGKRGVTQADIERAVLLAGDAKGLTLKSAIAVGSQPGGAKLIVEGEAALVTGSVLVDNRLPAELGTWESSLSLSLNNPLGFGEQFSFLFGTALRGQPTAGLRTPLEIFGVGVSAPLGDDGVTIRLEYTHSLTRPLVAADAPQTVGTFDRAALTLEYPVIRERSETLTLDTSVDYIAQSNRAPLFGIDLDRDRYAAIRLAADWQRTEPDSSQWQTHWVFSQGIGGRSAADATEIPLSRLGASPDFSKLNVDAQLSQRLGQDFSLHFFARGQYSWGRPLFVSEQFALDAADGVSGFASGAFSVDSGVTLRAELAKSTLTEVPGLSILWSPYVFADIGKGWLDRATQAENAGPLVGSLGVGVRLGFQTGLFQDSSFDIEVAHRYSNMLGERSGNRVTLSLGQKF